MRDLLAATLILAGLVVLSAGVNPLSPVVQQAFTRRASGQRVWGWPVAIALAGLVLMVGGALIR